MGSTISPTVFAGTDKDYVQKLNTMAAALANGHNENHQLLLSAIGPGADLILRVFDRDGIVDAASYQLDFTNYVGGVQITIGRRPTFDVLHGDVDTSFAWATFGGTKDLVQQVGDLLLDASAIITGLPKTIFIGIPASGVAQLFEDQTAGNVLYIWSMSYNGFSFDTFKRLGPILPGYETLKAMTAFPRYNTLYDGDTNWVDGPAGQVSDTEIVTLGDAVDNGIGLEGSVEGLGFLVSAHKVGDDHWNAPTGNPPDSLVTLKVVSAAVDWTGEIEIDVGQVPDTIFVPILAGVGDLKFITEVRRFTLERVSIGSAVVSARGMTWGLLYRPLLGAAAPKDSTTVEVI